MRGRPPRSALLRDRTILRAGEGDSGCKPLAGDGIYPCSTRRWEGHITVPGRRVAGGVSRGPVRTTWLVGGAGFSRFPPLAAGAGESRKAGGPPPTQEHSTSP